MTIELKGVWAAATTPQNAELEVDHEKLVRHYRWLLATGCNGIAVGGTTGEANSFSLGERRAIIETVAKADFSPEQIMIGVGCCAIPDTVTLAKAAIAAGYANTLMLPPFYYKGVSDDGLFAAYARTIELINDDRLRVYVYDFPTMTGLEISAGLLKRLHDAFPNIIVGVKDSSGRQDDMEEVCATIPGFGTFAGTEKYLLPVLRAGGVGCISATANVTAPLAAAVYRAFQAEQAGGDVGATDQAQTRATDVRSRLDNYGAIPSMKELLAVHTGDDAWRNMRPPLVGLNAEKAAALRAEMHSAQFALADAA